MDKKYLEILKVIKDADFFKRITNSELDESFMREYKEFLNWYDISYTQKMSESFLKEMSHLIDWEGIFHHMLYYEKVLSKEFILEKFKYMYNKNIAFYLQQLYFPEFIVEKNIENLYKDNRITKNALIDILSCQNYSDKLYSNLFNFFYKVYGKDLIIKCEFFPTKVLLKKFNLLSEKDKVNFFIYRTFNIKYFKDDINKYEKYIKKYQDINLYKELFNKDVKGINKFINKLYTYDSNKKTYNKNNLPKYIKKHCKLYDDYFLADAYIIGNFTKNTIINGKDDKFYLDFYSYNYFKNNRSYMCWCNYKHGKTAKIYYKDLISEDKAKKYTILV